LDPLARSLECATSHSATGGRIFRRIHELLAQLVLACKAIGDSNMEEVFTAGSKLLHRGIIFAGSLYI
jgi:ATP-dependent RNA helicase DOB1